MQFALRHPTKVTALVLLVPALYVPRADNAPSVHTPPGMQFMVNTVLQSDFLFWLMSKFARDTLIRIVLATPPTVMEQAPAEEQVRVQQVIDRLLPISQRRTGLLNEAKVIPFLPRYALEDITVPTLAVSCADDLFGTYDAARYTADHIRGAKFVGYPNGGHLWVGHQHELTKEITQFLKAKTADEYRKPATRQRQQTR
jgi:pimeloyl-ACP methyl ester carboxylesterase